MSHAEVSSKGVEKVGPKVDPELEDAKRIKIARDPERPGSVWKKILKK